MGRAISEWFRVAAMLGMVILVPLTAMFGSSATSELATWIFEVPWGAKLASAREAPVSFRSGEPFVGSFLETPSRGREICGVSNCPPVELSENKSSEGVLSASISGGGLAFCKKEENKEERVVLGEGVCSKNESLGNLPLLVSEESVASGPPEGVFPSSALFCPWQKECQELGRYLEKLGTTQYRLESWGSTGRLYHFQCRVKVLPEGSQWTRHFEATASDPLEAVQAVVDEVGQWRAESRNK